MNKPGNLYVIHEVGTEHYKIGITSSDVALRLKTLQTGNASKLEIVQTYWVDNMGRCEAMIHEALAQYHISGEWYKLDNPSQVEILLQKHKEHITNEIDGYVLRQVGSEALSPRFNFCLDVLSRSDLDGLGKFIMFLWALFVPLVPKIGLVELTNLEKRQRLHDWYRLDDDGNGFQQWG